MNIKLAEDIVKEMEERGTITVPQGCVTGEDFEEWLYEQVVNKIKKTKEGKSNG